LINRTDPLSYLPSPPKQEIIMNFVGAFMFVAVGGTALHYWHGYQPEQKFVYDAPERQVSRIIEMMQDERDCRDPV